MRIVTIRPLEKSSKSVRRIALRSNLFMHNHIYNCHIWNFEQKYLLLSLIIFHLFPKVHFMKKPLLLAVLIFSFIKAHPQDNKRTFIIGNGLDRVKSQDEIVFFGYDMSNLKCTVKQRDMSDFALCTRIPSEIMNWLHAQYGTNKIRREIGVKKLTFENAAVQLRIRDLQQNCLTTEVYSINESQLRNIVKSYSIPDKYNGKIGFAGITENLNRMSGGRGYASIYFVFFDCSTKDILYACHSYGNDAGGNNMRTFWGEAIMKAYRKFYKELN
jgi:hypothetical protein